MHLERAQNEQGHATMTTSLKELTFQDLLRPELQVDPYPLFRRLRCEDPVHEDPSGAGWMVTRYDDIASVLSDPRFSAARLLPRDKGGSTTNPVQAALARQMLFLDPPDHTRLRKLFAKAFSPGRLEHLRPQILQLTTELLDRAEDAGGRIDYMRDFAGPLPVTVIAQMLGMPAEDRPRLRDWSASFGRLINGRIRSDAETAEAQQGILAFIDYFSQLIEERRRLPQNDMLSDLIAVEEMGDRLSTEELIMNLILLLAAGHGTTTHLLGNGLFALLRHPDQWKLLVEDPAIAPAAVNELLRFDAPVQATSREALEDVPLGDKVIVKGQRVRVLLGSANRDDAHFNDPDTLDLKRSGARIISFGHGIHACLGVALARLEAQVALPELARRFPRARVLAEAPERTLSVSFRGFQSLPVSLSS
jgi:cytochrome P450